MADSIPIICITGQAPRTKLHQESFQAVDIVEIAKPVTKWAVQLKEPGQAPWVFREAFRIARSGRPGPGADRSADRRAARDVHLRPGAGRAAARRRPGAASRSRCAAAIRMLLARRTADHPRRRRRDQRRRVRGAARARRAPAGAGAGHADGQGRVPRGPSAVRRAWPGIQTQTRWGNAAFLESDLVLAVGARFGDRHTGDLETYRRGRRFIHVDIEPTQLGKVFDARPRHRRARPARRWPRSAKQARARVPAPGPTRGWTGSRELRGTLLRRDDFDDVPIKPPRVYRELNEYFGPDTTFVTAIGLYQIWSGQFQHTFRPRHYLVCGQAGPLGLGDPGRDRRQVRLPGPQVGGRGRRRLLLPVPDGGDRRRGPVQDPVRDRHGEQRVPGADPAGRAAATT